MDTDDKEEVGQLLEGELTEKILGSAFKVLNTLGSGFLEKIYENALVLELRRLEIEVEQQKPLKVHYEGVVVGEYLADLIVGGRVIVECKAVSHLDPAHEAQLLNYLKAMNLRVGLLFNFGRPKLQYRRFVL
jgi:GxxExxY protein